MANNSSEDMRNQLRKIAEILKKKSLADKELLTEEGWKRDIREFTQPFLKKVAEKIENKISVKAVTKEKKDVKKYRAYYDRVYIKDRNKIEYTCTVGMYPRNEEDIIGQKLKDSIWWGLFFGAKEEEVKKKVNELNEMGLNVEQGIDPGHWRYCILIKGRLKPEDMEKIEDPEKLIEEIADDIVELYKKVQKKQRYTDSSKIEKLRHFLYALETKPFIILSGISGTGKTQIARIISAGLVENSSKEHKK